MKHIDEKILDERLRYIEQDQRYSNDPFGLSPQRFAQVFRILCPLYDEYFRVRTFGSEHIPTGPLMLVSNHSGQLPFDGIVLTMSYFLHAPEPIIPRGMAERFLMKLPFLGKLSAETGGILGDRHNCQYVLNQKEIVMVFPEGTRGINKSTKDFYQLKSFSIGFLRLCLQFKTPIVPVAIVGAEELYPLVVQSPWIAKLLRVPSMPITPLFPLAGLLGMIPLPAPIDIYYGQTIPVNSKYNAEDPDHVLRPEVERIQNIIQNMVREGLQHKRPIWDEELKDNLKHYYEKFRDRLKLVKEFLDQDKK